MEKYESDETLIARWVAGELNDEELSEFKQSKGYALFYRINEEAQNFKAPPIDKRQALLKTKEQITFGKRQQSSSIRSNLRWYAMAAAIAVLVGVFGLLNMNKSYQTAYGEQLAVTLPDGSTVKLNAGSELKHKRFFWLNDKVVTLEGEAYFNVQKSEGFAVATSYGTVSVLGTQFNINSRQHAFELDCFEGVVQFDQIDPSGSQILRKNDRIVVENTKMTKETSVESQPDWMRGMSIFKEAPLQEVIEEMQRQYGVTFQSKETDMDRLFTGSFTHDNLDIALKTTLTPLGITYIVSEDKTTVILP